MLPEVSGYPQEHELRAMPLMERLAHAHRVAMTEDKETIEMAADRITELEAALLKIAFGETDDLAGNPTKWSSTVAYLALGGRFEGGVRVHERVDLQNSKSQ